MFIIYIDDLSRINDLKRQVNKLEGECNKKDKVIRSQVITISTLRAIDYEAKASIED